MRYVSRRSRTRKAPMCSVVLERCPDLRRKGRGSRRRSEAGGRGDRIGLNGRQIWIAEGNGYRCPNGKEGIREISEQAKKSLITAIMKRLHRLESYWKQRKIDVIIF